MNNFDGLLLLPSVRPLGSCFFGTCGRDFISIPVHYIPSGSELQICILLFCRLLSSMAHLFTARQNQRHLLSFSLSLPSSTYHFNLALLSFPLGARYSSAIQEVFGRYSNGIQESLITICIPNFIFFRHDSRAFDRSLSSKDQSILNLFNYFLAPNCSQHNWPWFEVSLFRSYKPLKCVKCRYYDLKIVSS